MSLTDNIQALALRYSEELKVQIANRVEENETPGRASTSGGMLVPGQAFRSGILMHKSLESAIVRVAIVSHFC